MASNKLARSPKSQEECRRNWQRIADGGITGMIAVGSVTTAMYADDSVTFAKMQNIATDRLLGRDTAGTGDVEQLTVGGGIEFTGSTGIQTSAFTGDATKTAGGTALTLATVNGNVGTFNNITINAKGLATAGSNVAYITGNQTITLTGDASGSGTTSIAVTLAVPTSSGTYTPTLTNVANLDASTAYQCQYLRVGNTVTVSGRVDIDPTLPATTTQLGISLPVASNIGAVEDVAGVGSSPGIAAQVMAILGDVTNDRAELNWKSSDTTNQATYFTFTYRVI